MRAVDISAVASASVLWQRLVDASPDAWLWHTWLAHEFNLEAGREYGAHDLSFFVYNGEQAIGAVPLIIEERSGRLQAAYYSGFLPWPCFAGIKGREDFENFVFVELERRARTAGAKSILVYLTPPRMTVEDHSRAQRIAEKYGYEVFSFESHLAVVDGKWCSRVRNRYKRYVRKFSSLFMVSVVESEGVTAELEEAYFRLHIADAGKQVRSRESYARQADFARKGEGFYVVARTADGLVVGMLLVSLYKGVAFDNSVGIDPAFAGQYVGHILRMRTLEELERRGVPLYELPLRPRAEDPASPKERGISHFKEGWTGGAYRTLWGIRKQL